MCPHIFAGIFALFALLSKQDGGRQKARKGLFAKRVIFGGGDSILFRKSNPESLLFGLQYTIFSSWNLETRAVPARAGSEVGESNFNRSESRPTGRSK